MFPLRAVTRPRTYAPAAEPLDPRHLLPPVAAFDYAMPDRVADYNGDGRIDLPNTAQSANPSGFTVNLDASPSTNTVTFSSYTWTVSGPGLAAISRSGKQVTLTDLPQGTYDVT